jgi:hypothetical protein
MAWLEVLEILWMGVGVGEDEAGGRVVVLAGAAKGDQEEERLPGDEGE